MRIVRTIALAAASVLIVSLLTEVQASAQPLWTRPEILGATGADVDMTVNASGDAVAVWISSRGVKASLRPAGQNWQHPQLLSRDRGGLLGAFMDDRGRATAVWWHDEQVMVADHEPGGRWRMDKAAPGASGGCCSVGIPTAQADSAGNLLVTWTESNDLVGEDRYLSWRSRDGRWYHREGGGSYFYPVVVNDGVATFARGLCCANPQEGGVFTQTAAVGESPTPWRRIWPGTIVGTPVMAANSNGDMVLAALDGDETGAMNTGDPGHLIVLTKPAGKAWRPAFRADIPRRAVYPAVAISDSGRIGVAYERAADSSLVVRTGNVRGRASGTAKVLSDRSRRAFPSIALSPRGAAVVTWAAKSPGSDYPVYAARRPARGKWREPVRLGSVMQGLPTVYAYPNGMFTALFIGGAVEWTDYVDDAVGPTTRLRAPRKRFMRATRLPVRWTAADALSRPATSDVRVRIGNRAGSLRPWFVWRRKTTRNSTRYTGKPGHTYCFSVRTRDRVGNLGSWSDRRCTTLPRDDRSFARSAGWRRVRQRGAYLRTLSVTRSGGERLRVPGVEARSVRLLARTCPRCGRVRVRYGGRTLGTFSLTSRRPRNRSILVGKFAHIRTGAVVIRTVRDGKPVRIDGLVGTR